MAAAVQQCSSPGSGDDAQVRSPSPSLETTQSPSSFALCESGSSHLPSSATATPPQTFQLRFPFSVRMSSSNPNQIIEHIVLFKAKPDADPSAVNAMLRNLNSLASLDSVLHLFAGPVSRCRSNSLTFTHMLHSRYRSKPDLNSYSKTLTTSASSRITSSPSLTTSWPSIGSPMTSRIHRWFPGSAIRLTILKLKEGTGESCKSDVLGTLKGVEEQFPSIEQLTVGENFSPGRAKGFSICSIAVFKGMKELEAMDSESELANEQKDKVDGVVVLDYVVAASAQSASL
ncbi:hypothetical protein DH2020_018558 [Rehmannia glutinosa]|uniref:Stress-response A/B barrel domain-containing protein n=1 Tax=Rehmannia glutinosa TaxID=99300 RepID=A0ABR0WM13_REHGL